MPSRRQVCTTRHAISPRLAIRIFANTSAPPAGLALAEEGVEPFLSLGRRAQACNDVGGACLEVVGAGLACDHRDELLDLALRGGAALEELYHDGLNSRVERVGRDDAVHEADGERALRVEALAGREELARLTCADGGDDVGRDYRGREPEAHLGKGEAGVARRD